MKNCAVFTLNRKRLFSILFYGGSFLNAIFQFRIIIVPPKKEKEAYLLTVILTIIDIILGISFSIAAVFVKIFTELNCIVFFFGIVAYAMLLFIDNVCFVCYRV